MIKIIKKNIPCSNFQQILEKETVKQLVAALLSFEVDFLFVGGCVRDSLLGNKVNDIDIAVNHDIDIVLKNLQQVGINTFSIDKHHGTIIANIANDYFHLTALRIDVKTYGRYAKIKRTGNWELDAKRRDFTINALYADHNGKILQPIETSLGDLQEGNVCFIGDPVLRIKEDYLRILRFLRFLSCFGKIAPDQKALNACFQYADMLKIISRERITYEVIKTLKGACFPKLMHFLKQASHTSMNQLFGSIFSVYQNELSQQRNFNFIDVYGCSNIFEMAKCINHKLSALLICITTFDLNEDQINRALVLKKQQKKYLNKIFQMKKNLKICLDDCYVMELAYVYGKQIAIDYMLHVFSKLSDGKAKDKQTYDLQMQSLQKLQDMEVPEFPVCANDIVVNTQYKFGKQIGDALKLLEDIWIKSKFSLNKQELLARIKI